MKRLACILVLMLLVSGVFFIQTAHAQGTGNQWITSNTEWTLAQSPINFNRSVTVENGTTLTIDPGVTVNLGLYQLLVYGTLIAQGNATSQIVFEANVNQSSSNLYSALIVFTSQSTSGTSSNPESVIQYALLNEVAVDVGSGAMVEVDSCVLSYVWTGESPINLGLLNGGSATISNNIVNYNNQGYGGNDVTTISIIGGTPSIVNNQFEESSGTSNGIGIAVTDSSPVISGNTFEASYGNGSYGVKVYSGASLITGNQFQGDGNLIGVDDSSSSASAISNNIFTDCYSGVTAESQSVMTVQGNRFLGGTDGIDILLGATVTVTDNLVDNNSRYGINGGGNIDGNTVTNNQIGIHNPLTGVINDNNIVGNTVNSITATRANIDATNNWWGIADTQTINQTIYDSKIDPSLGTISFVPFLTAPNPSAPPIPSLTPTIAPVPTEASTPTPSEEPVIPTLTPTATPEQNSQLFLTEVDNVLNLNMITISVAIILVLAWVVVILSYVTKSVLSKKHG